MLAVHGQQRLTRPPGRVHDQVAAGDQGLLVGQEHLPPGPQGIHDALQPGNAHHSHQHHVRLHLRGGGMEGLRPHDPAAEAAIRGDLLRGNGFHQAGHFRAEGPHLLKEQLLVPPGRQRPHGEAVRVKRRHLQRLGADGPCAA